MKVPYAKKWQSETDELRKIVLDCDLVEESGKKVPLKKASEYVVPEELQVRLNAAPELKAAFEALTPGRRK